MGGSTLNLPLMHKSIWIRFLVRFASWAVIALVMALLAFFIIGVAHAQTYTVTVNKLSATATVEQNLPTATSSITSIENYVKAESIEYGINPKLTSCIISNESQWNPTKLGDDGNSRGLWQISQIWHPEVSNAVAFSAVSSTLWSLSWIKAGHIKQWSTYREYCSDISVFI